MKLPIQVKELCVQHHIAKIQLRYTGGGDEGEFEFEIEEMVEGHEFPPQHIACELDQLVLDWADEEFNFGGDGAAHGEQYMIDLVANTVTHTSWQMEAVYDDPETEEVLYVKDEDDTV